MNISGFDRSKLKKTQTTVKELPGTQLGSVTEKKGGNRVLLILTKHWVCFQWFSPASQKILFTYENQRDLISEEAKSAFVHIEYFSNFHSGLVEFQAKQLHEKFHFTHVIGLAEEDLIRTAQIKNTLKLPFGQDLESALQYRDKVLMKEVLVKSGIKTPIFKRVESSSDAIDFMLEFGYPFVIKPRKGYSSVNTWIIHKEEQFKQFLDSGFNTVNGFDSSLDLEIETFCHGQMYHIDGIVYKGEPRLIWPSCYVGVCADFKKTGFLASYALHPENPLVSRLQKHTYQTLKALKSPECHAFHSEAWVTPQDEIVFCEIASRMGGAGVRHVLREMFGIHPDKISAQFQAGEEPSEAASLKEADWTLRKPDVDFLVGWLFIYPQVGKLSYIPEKCPLEYVIGYQPFAQVGEIFHSRANCVDAAVSVTIKGSTEKETEQNILDCVKWFNETTRYDKI